MIFVLMAWITNVQTEPTSEDAQALQELGFGSARQRPTSFREEVELIRSVQEKILSIAPHKGEIPEFSTREIKDLVLRRSGFCYDRSRAIDKTLRYLGFETRHVYLLYRTNKYFLHALLTYGQPSHAVTEVRTSKGWMLVDSNNAWIALTRDGHPVAADRVYASRACFETIAEPFGEPWWSIRGLYSRKGFFYRPYLPFPELNWSDFLSSLVESR